jgi:uncharacterized membrane protein YphA (DoxX/SURF4 family)
MSKIAPLAARIVLGLMFVMTGSNGFLHFMPMPPLTGAAAEVMHGFEVSGYLLPLLFLTQLVGGLCVVSGRLTAFGLLLLAPVLVNIIGYHLFVDLKGTGMPAVLFAAEVFLAWSYRRAFAPIFAKPEQTGTAKTGSLTSAAT